MRTLCFSMSTALAVLACLVYLTPPCRSQEVGLKVSPPGAVESFPNTVDGLHSVLSGLLSAAKKGDQDKLRSKIRDMEIPDFDNWFMGTDGQEKGRALAEVYGKSLAATEEQFELLWMELARQEGEISISKVDAATRRFVPAKADDVLANPSDDFRAEWKKTDSSAGPARQAIGLFCFVDGKFRLKSFPHEVQILSSAKPGAAVPAKPTNVVPAKLMNRVPPEYPETARRLKVQGLVSLNVVIRKDGTVTVQSVGAGNPVLVPAAVAAVEQWKYEPTRIDGEPFDVQTKVYVTFKLIPSVPRVTVKGEVMKKMVVHKINPKYPSMAMHQRIGGTVTLRVLIGVDGSVKEAEFVSGPAIFVQPTIDAVRQWKYKPSTASGQPVEVDTTVEVVFSFIQ